MDEETALGLTAVDWTAIYTLLTLGLLAVAVLAALYARRQWGVAREQIEESRKAQAEATRPYVIVSVEPSAATRHLFDLVVRNIGQRPAVDLKISLDPAPSRARETEGHELSRAKMLNEPVAMIAPGQEMRAFYDSHIDRNGRDDLPTSHRVTLAYQDTSGHDYAETGVIDIDALKGTLFTTVKTVHDIGKTLAEMQRTLSSASVLGPRGSIDVEASVESHVEQQERLAHEQAEAEEQHARLARVLLPHLSEGEKSDGSRPADRVAEDDTES